jgi:hypothetical protein
VTLGTTKEQSKVPELDRHGENGVTTCPLNFIEIVESDAENPCPIIVTLFPGPIFPGSRYIPEAMTKPVEKVSPEVPIAVKLYAPPLIFGTLNKQLNEPELAEQPVLGTMFVPFSANVTDVSDRDKPIPETIT